MRVLPTGVPFFLPCLKILSGLLPILPTNPTEFLSGSNAFSEARFLLPSHRMEKKDAEGNMYSQGKFAHAQTLFYQFDPPQYLQTPYLEGAT